MTSPAAAHQDSMIYEHPSTTSTRAIVDGSPTSPDTGSEYHSPSSFPPHSHADAEQELHEYKPHLHRRRTNNYEDALTERAVASGATDPHPVSGLVYRGDNAVVDTPQPGLLGRQQSFKSSDQKRAAMEHLLNADTKLTGYSTTSPPAAGK